MPSAAWTGRGREGAVCGLAHALRKLEGAPCSCLQQLLLLLHPQRSSALTTAGCMPCMLCTRRVEACQAARHVAAPHCATKGCAGLWGRLCIGRRCDTHTHKYRLWRTHMSMPLCRLALLHTHSSVGCHIHRLLHIRMSIGLCIGWRFAHRHCSLG